MRPKLNSASTITAAWILTVGAAFWLGSHRGQAGADRDQPSASERDSAEARALGAAASGEGARPLSLPPAGTGRDAGGRAAERILHLLSGAAGADLKRSEFSDLAGDLSLEEVVDLIGQLATMAPGPAQRDAYNEVLGRWAQLDPTAALAHANTIGPPKLRHDATINVLRHWAEVDPAGAIAHVAANPNSDLPESSLQAVFRGIGNSADTTAALGFLSSLGEDHQEHVAEAVRELFERNDAEVIAWAQALPEGAIRDRSIRALIDQWARYDPGAAQAWLEENTRSSNRAGALVELGESWARSDPAAAASWAMGMGGEARGPVLERVFRRWMEYDIAGAAGFLAQQEPSPELDGALEQYVQRIKSFDPDATMAWAESISDPGRRRDAILQVAKIWRSRDRQAYESYVSNSPIFSDAEREKLLGKEKSADRQKPKDRHHR